MPSHEHVHKYPSACSTPGIRETSVSILPLVRTLIEGGRKGGVKKAFTRMLSVQFSQADLEYFLQPSSES